MADVGSTNRHLFIKKYERNKLVAQAEILGREIRIIEIGTQISATQDNVLKQQEKLEGMKNPDPSNLLATKKFERERFSLLANIQTLEIRVLELQEEIERSYRDIEAQQGVIQEMDFNIKQQQDLIAKGE